MALEDIERLKEKINKDPNSKLFVPLAEEYKKAGMFDEAVDVLSQGLERQPGYLSARVSLGKIYLERGMLSEARAEFEKVIGVIPDNLYAHKKLAEIYKDLGENDKTIRELKTVLNLNPMDEWASSTLSTMEEKPASRPSETVIQKEEKKPSAEQEAGIPAEGEEISLLSMSTEDVDLLERHPKIAAETEDEGKMPGFSLSEEARGLWQAPTGAVEEPKEEKVKPSGIDYGRKEPDLWELPEEELTEVKEEIPEESRPSEIDLSKEEPDLWEFPSEEELSEVKEEEPEEEKPLEIPSGQDEDLWESLPEAAEEGKETVKEGIAGFEELSEEESLSFADVFKEHEVTAEMGEEIHPAVSVSDADPFILQGRYMEAMRIYRNILSVNPENIHLLQRIEELKALLKLLGKDKEALIVKLDSLLTGIKKRRDEFLGSS